MTTARRHLLHHLAECAGWRFLLANYGRHEAEKIKGRPKPLHPHAHQYLHLPIRPKGRG